MVVSLVNAGKQQRPFQWPVLDLLPPAAAAPMLKPSSPRKDRDGHENDCLVQLRLSRYYNSRNVDDAERSAVSHDDPTEQDDMATEKYIAELRARIYERYVACARLQAKLAHLAAASHDPRTNRDGHREDEIDHPTTVAVEAPGAPPSAHDA
jgi:hypothetical protein